MVEMKNDCNSCVHKSICKYTEQFQKSMGDIVKIANDHFAVYDFNDLDACADNMTMNKYIAEENKNGKIER